MVSDSIGATALKAAAVFSAISVFPPLFLDDRSRPSTQMLAGGVAVSAVLVALAALLSIYGRKHASRQVVMRYSSLVVAFACACAILFAFVISRGTA